MTDQDLIAEQLARMTDTISSRFKLLESQLSHYNEITERRLDMLEKCTQDHENRLRVVTEAVAQFKMFTSLAFGLTALLSFISLIKTFIP